MRQKQHTATQLYSSDSSQAAQRQAFTGGEIPVAVYGLGKMGLPLATVFATVTNNVTGVDIDPTVIEQLQAGDCPVQGEPGLDEAVEQLVAADNLDATTDSTTAATDARVHVVIVPTLITDSDEPDLSALDSVVSDIASGLTPGDMVILESTVPPGTCRDIVGPALADRSGLDQSEFGLAFCPERTASGRALRDIRGAYPKVVGGKDAESTRVSDMIYSEITSNEVVPVGDCTTAECVKLFEGLYRDVNIALANELARLANELSIDVNEAIEAASMPEYCDIHSPGPGVGGHCIPYYPHFVMSNTETETPLLRQARDVNEEMPAHTVELLEQRLAEQGIDLEEATVGLLGITYRAGVDETRAAPSFPIASMLSAAGSTVYAADPVCSDASGLAAERIETDELSTVGFDAAVVVTAHEQFESIDWNEIDECIILDGRRVIEDELPHPVYTLGDGTDQPTTVPETDQ